jgi:phosphoglycerate kinase
MEREVDVLGTIDDAPSPHVYLLGGAKVDDSLAVARNVLEQGLADEILAAGVVGNAFLLADGVQLGAASAAVVNDRSSKAVRRAGKLLDDFASSIHLPGDVAVERNNVRVELNITELPSQEAAMDVGAQTVRRFSEHLESAGTAILNGPVGVFENEGFAYGTRELYEAATRAGHSIVGGGDTSAALRDLEVGGFSHVSTGGGACLNMLTGEPLPAVDALRNSQ